MSGIPDRRPVVLALHGFTLGGAMFRVLAGLVDADFITPDLPGHGGRDATGCAWEEAVAESMQLIEQHRPDVLLGYSMGGRLALAAALESGLSFAAVFASTGLGIADANERVARRSSDEAMARQIEETGIDEFLVRWESTEQLRGHPELADIRRANTAAGIAASLRGMGQGAQPYLGARLDELARPTMWLAGEADGKYLSIARRAADAAPNATMVAVAGERHNVVAAAPSVVAAAISDLIVTRRSA